MDKSQLLEDMLAILQEHGIEVRSESMGGSGGGLCSFAGKQVYFVDTDAPEMETNAITARTVGEIVDIEEIYLRPQVRELIEHSA